MYKILILDEATYSTFKNSFQINQKVIEMKSPEELLRYIASLLPSMGVKLYHERVTLRTLSYLVSSLNIEILGNLSVELLIRGYNNLDYTNEIIVVGKGS